MQLTAFRIWPKNGPVAFSFMSSLLNFQSGRQFKFPQACSCAVKKLSIGDAVCCDDQSVSVKVFGHGAMSDLSPE
jgi:hypothetical protein